MVSPIPSRPITTPYGKRGSHWSCRKDSHGNGIHTGFDIAAPVGTSVLAMRPGVARHVDYGPAFGRHQLAIRCSDGTEDFYAHMRWRIADGTKVQAGQKIGEVGTEGNSTGAHLHGERHRSQGHWNCDVIVNPAPSINWRAATDVGGGGGMAGLRQGGKVYASKMVPGTRDSDSVWNVQVALKHWDTGITWHPTGNFGDPTREAVARFQREHGWTGVNADGVPGPETVHQLGLVWVDDSEDPV